MVSKTSWYMIIVTIVCIVSIFALLAILTPDVFAGIVSAVDNGLYILFGTLPLLALTNGSLALIGFALFSFVCSVLIWHYGIERWWNNRKKGKQTSILSTMTYQKEPAPEQGPKAPQIPTPIPQTGEA